MDPLTPQLTELLERYGPGLVFLLAALETSFVTGLVVPAGVAASVATVLALEGSMKLPSVVLAAMAGGAVGDVAGFWVGRWAGPRVLEGRGWFARRARSRRNEMESLFARHPFVSVTGARLVSFVRTLMPLFAGMSGLRFRRFLVYDLLGVTGWMALYVGIGLLARESWHAATRFVGVAGMVVFFLVVSSLLKTLRARRRARRVGATPGAGEHRAREGEAS